ncbi:MAG: hypothetical protein A4E49_01437 [Methanosaeta sp. PtaU1.Bin112]|nr:MAG: hypothetical protein A4E49_01437 [Methanosaeta sp. PtaU1.Bin112]
MAFCGVIIASFSFYMVSMSLLTGTDDLVEFIAENYSGRVVEVGAGYVPEVAQGLQARGLDVVLTDKEERLLSGLRVEKDDIFSPRLELYREASLLYSIRPPLEMQLAMGQLAAKIGADVLIRPLMDEVAELPGFSRRLVNRGQARFYLFAGKQQV